MSFPWAQIFTVTVPIMAGFGTLAYQTRTARKKAEIENYLRAYNELIASVGDIATAIMGHGDKGQADKRYALAKMSFSLVASERSLKALSKFDSLVTGNPIAPPGSDKSRALVNIIRSARADLSMGSDQVSDAELMRSTPFSE